MRLRDLRRRLEHAGRSPAPGPSEEFVERLALRLAAQRALPEPALPEPALPEPAPPAHVLLGRRGLRAVALAAAVAAVAGLAALVGRPEDRRVPLRLAYAADATVQQPDGKLVRARTGMEVGEGFILRTGPAGSLVIGGVRIGPNRVAEVRGGAVRLVGTAPPSTWRAGRSPARPAPIPSVTLVPTSPVPFRSTPPPPTTAAPTTRPPDGRAAPMMLYAYRTSRGTFLAWSRYEGSGFYAYVVLRAADPTDPTYPPSGATVEVGRVHDLDGTGLFDPSPGDAAVRYRVVVIDSGGRELARTGVAGPV